MVRCQSRGWDTILRADQTALATARTTTVGMMSSCYRRTERQTELKNDYVRAAGQLHDEEATPAAMTQDVFSPIWGSESKRHSYCPAVAAERPKRNPSTFRERQACGNHIQHQQRLLRSSTGHSQSSASSLCTSVWTRCLAALLLGRRADQGGRQRQRPVRLLNDVVGRMGRLWRKF